MQAITQKRLRNAAAAAAVLTGKPRVAQGVQRRVAATQLVTELFALRTARGMTQADVAKQMGCGQAKISKLEAGTDAQLSVAELRGYLKALGISARLMIDNQHVPVAQRITQHVLALHDMLEQLAGLVKQVSDDTRIVNKIHEFYGEVLFNFMLRFGQSYEKVRSLIALQPPVQEKAKQAGRRLSAHGR
jgi:transcriptional regulator with XRE-family HTH domain